MKMRYFAILLLSAVLLTGCGGGAGAVRVLAQKSIGHLPIMWYTIRVSGSADNGPLPESTDKGELFYG